MVSEFDTITAYKLALGRPSLVQSRVAETPCGDQWAERKGREGEGSGDAEQDVVGSVGMLAEPIRLRSGYGM